MPSIELGNTAPVGATDARIATRQGSDAAASGKAAATQAASPSPSTSTSTSTSSATMVQSKVLEPASSPVDTDRVAQIRRAIETGTYPILPMRVSDAIIAAGFLLTSETQ